MRLLNHLFWLPLTMFHTWVATLAPRWVVRVEYRPASETERARSEEARNALRRAEYAAKKRLIS